jgi:hypothetical protein
MAFKTLSHRFEGDFQDQIEKLAADLKAKKQAQFAPPSTPDPQQNAKDQAVNGVLPSIQQFNDRLVKEWLHSLDDSDLQEVKRVFDEINQLSAGEVQQLMGHSTPFELVGGMFKTGPAEGGNPGHACGCGDAEVVTEIDLPLDNTSNHGQHEGMGGQVA